mgnify:CR=1 FL=1
MVELEKVLTAEPAAHRARTSPPPGEERRHRREVEIAESKPWME